MANPLDLVGQKFGKLSVIERAENNRFGQTQWLCKCECGQEKVISANSLMKGATKTCGLHRKSNNFLDITGQKFGRLTVVSRGKNTKTGRARWNCLCECGKTKLITTSTLKNGRSLSCGCIRSEGNTKRLTIHGGADSPEYAIWMGMRQRCSNPSNKEFHNYGGRGIKVCKRWQSFKNFIADMGQRPSKDLSIERINNDKGYSPGNCKWGTTFEQANNTRANVFFCIDGVEKTVSQWSRISGVPPTTIYGRIRSGWPVEKAVFQSVSAV